MKTSIRMLFLTLSLLLGACASTPEKAVQGTEKASTTNSSTVRRYEAGDRGFFVIAVPSGWAEEIRPSRNPHFPPEISCRPLSGSPFVVMMSFAWLAEGAKPSLNIVREIIESRADELKPNAVEAMIQIRELSGPQVHGYYFSVTDRAPKVGEYKYMTQGALAVEDFVMTFTILTNDGQEAVVDRAIVMVRNAVQQKR